MKNFLQKNNTTTSRDSQNEADDSQLGASHQRFLNKFKKSSSNVNADNANQASPSHQSASDRGAASVTPNAFLNNDTAISDHHSASVSTAPDYYSPPTTTSIDHSFDNISYNTSNWYSLNGRIGRIQFLAFSVIWGLLLGFVYMVAILLGSLFGPGSSSAVLALVSVFSLPIAIFAYIILPRRRLHDINKSGWWLLLYLVPIANLLMVYYLYFKRGDEGFNDYGLPPAPYSKVEFWLAMLVPIFMILGIVAGLMLPSYFEEMQQEAMADILKAEQEIQNNEGAATKSPSADPAAQGTNKITNDSANDASNGNASSGNGQNNDSQSQDEAQVAAAMAGTDSDTAAATDSAATSEISYEDFLQEAESTIYREPSK